MDNNSSPKFPRTLSQYLRLKAKEFNMSETELSKMIIPGSSGSLIASIIFNQRKLSEEKIIKIAEYFKEDHLMLTFMAGKIPKSIHEMIVNNKEVQVFLLDLLKRNV